MRLTILARAFLLALAQLGDRRLIAPPLAALAAVLVLTAPFAGLFVGLAWLVEKVTSFSVTVPNLGTLGFAGGGATEGLAARASWTFWSWVTAPLVLAVTGFFLDPIVTAVERRHYPGLDTPRARGVLASLAYATRFLFYSLAVSLAAFLVSLLSGWLAPAVFIGANGWLIAREYFETAALRHVSPQVAQSMERTHFPTLWLAGAGVAAGLAVPFANLLMPVVGVAAFTHLFHRLRPAATFG